MMSNKTINTDLSAPYGNDVNRDKRFYGRRKGRSFSPKAQKDYDVLLSQHQFDPKAWSYSNETWFEIGFGGGEHLVEQAKNHPEINFIAAEPFENGVLSCLRGIGESKLINVKIWKDDVRFLIPKMPSQSISKAFMLFPDPWRKTRHHKRRLLNHQLLESMARILKDQAEFRVASDHDGYVEWMQDLFQTQDFFKLKTDPRNPVTLRPESWYPTRYEAKALEAGRVCRYFTLIRK